MNLRELLAKARRARSGDELAGIAAATAEERVRAQMKLADVPLKAFLAEPVIPYETDEVTRLICDSHDAAAFAPIAHLTVGEFRDWLLSERRHDGALSGACARGHAGDGRRGFEDHAPAGSGHGGRKMPRGDALPLHHRTARPPRPRACSRIIRPTISRASRRASSTDLRYGNGDAVIGVNPASDNVETVEALLRMLDAIRERYRIPTQICVLAHVTTQMQALARGAPVDLVFQSIAGTEAANAAFGVNLAMLDEACQAARELKRGENVMYFETGQGSALSANAHHGVDQQTCEARAYAVARRYQPLLVNTVVGFIGPEYLYDGKQIMRAGLEDHFCGKLLGLPMGCDVCYTNHAEADQDDMDALLTMLGVAGCNYIMGVPGADDVMLHYQSTSFHDALYLRSVLGLKPAPEFEAWLEQRPRLAIRAMAIDLTDSPPRAWPWAAPATACRRANCCASNWTMPARATRCTRSSIRAVCPRPHVVVRSAARDRGVYLRRPDLGRTLSAESRRALHSAITMPPS